MSKKSNHAVTQAQTTEALRVLSALAAQLQPEYAPFSYGPPPGVPMTPGNALPALVVWLFLTTNPEFFLTLEGSSQAPPEAAIPIEALAEAVNLTPECVQQILALYQPGVNDTAFRSVAGVFQSFAVQSLYTRPNCPGGPEAMVQLAKKGAAVDPHAIQADPIGG